MSKRPVDAGRCLWFILPPLLRCGVMFKAVPGGFIPTQDKLYLIGGVKCRKARRWRVPMRVIRKMSEIGMNTEGVDYAVAFPA